MMAAAIIGAVACHAVATVVFAWVPLQKAGPIRAAFLHYPAMTPDTFLVLALFVSITYLLAVRRDDGRPNGGRVDQSLKMKSTARGTTAQGFR